MSLCSSPGTRPRGRNRGLGDSTGRYGPEAPSRRLSALTTHCTARWRFPRSASDGHRRGEPLRADEDLPRLDAHDAELVGERPGVVGEAAVDLRLRCLHSRSRARGRARARVPASGPPKRTNALVCERVHERCVLVYCRLLEDPAGCPGGSCFADDGEVAHARAIR